MHFTARLPARQWLVRIMVAVSLLTGPGAAAAADDWPTSLHDLERTGASADPTLTPANAASLTPQWTFATGGPVASTPTVTGGVAYVGSWDGYEYALDAATGALKWRTQLGITTGRPVCIPPQLGVSSPATVTGGVVYVGGGDTYWYALDAADGHVLWRVFTGDNSAESGHYNWSGPLIYNGYAYVGVASLGDCPLVQGQLLKINLTTHQIENTLNLVPNGQVGGGIWTSPALDVATGLIYTATGTENSSTQPYAQAFLAIDANTLQIKDRWRLPENEAVLDSDFSTSTTLFTDSGGRKLVAATNKNGFVYAFERAHLAAGPVWKQAVAVGGFCPTCGQSSVSSGAFGSGQLYQAGAGGTIDGQGYPGTVRALDPATGAYLWQHPSSGAVIGALAYVNGLVLAGSGQVFEALDAVTGRLLYSYDTGAQIYAGPSVADGRVYTANTNGTVFAFGLGSLPVAAADPDCPAGWTCQVVGNATPAGGEAVGASSWTVAAGGSGLAGAADGARLVTRPAPGDGTVQVTATVTDLPPVTAQAQAGVMLRENNTAGSPFFAVMVKPNNQLVVLERRTFGGAVRTVATATRPALPLSLMIQRRSNQLTAATSAGGGVWTLVPGSTATLVLPDAALAGVAVSSGANGTSGSATVADVSVGAPTVTPQPPAPASPCPTGWSCQDVGNPALIGDQALDSAGTWTVTGGGNDIWEDKDQFHLVYQDLPADGTVSARVTAQDNPNPYAKAGVMLRQDTAADAPYYAAYVTPGHGLQVQYREVRGLPALESATVAGAAPAYLRVARSGDAFTAYTSADGVAWTAVVDSTMTLPGLSGTLAAGLALTSHNVAALGTATFTDVALSGTAPPPPNLCPAGWACQDIGFPTPKGGQTLADGAWTLQAGGGDIWADYDYFRLVSQNLNGDGFLSARLINQGNTGPWAKAGVMLRLSADPQAPYFAAFMTPAHCVAVQWRAVQGGQTSQVSANGTAPIYLKVARTGTSFAAFTSPDGVAWTAVPGTNVNLPGLGGTMLAGLAADSYDPSNLNTTTFDAVVLESAGGSGGGLPSPWADTDVGGATPAGSAAYANNTFTVNGGGADIWQAEDQFHYVYQSLSGDGILVARVTSQTNTDSWAKAGIMLKSSPAAGSPYAMLMVTPDHGLHFQANFNSDQGGDAYHFPNAWLRLTRTGSVVTAASSGDGVNWVTVSQTTMDLGPDVTIGLAVTAHNGGTALGTATFDNVTVIPSGGGQLPAPWTAGDVGTPLLPGSSSYANGTFTVRGSGNDVWGTNDQLQFASQPLADHAQIVARVVSQDNTDPWAKAGLMIKSSLVSGAPYAALFVTPGNGLHFQSNFDADVAGGGFAFPNAWLKLTRAGDTITAYQSADGTNWTLVGSATVPLGDGAGARIGMFVCAHNGSAALGTSVFDHVTVGP